jgi:hypothetical protein
VHRVEIHPWANSHGKRRHKQSLALSIASVFSVVKDCAWSPRHHTFVVLVHGADRDYISSASENVWDSASGVSTGSKPRVLHIVQGFADTENHLFMRWSDSEDLPIPGTPTKCLVKKIAFIRNLP